MNKNRWLKLMGRVGLKDNLDTYNKLLACYNQKHRFYHNVNHITAVLNYLDKSKQFAEDHNAIELALWFHDAIYKPLSSSNERDSANWASEFLHNNGASPALSSHVHSLIMATQHNAIPNENDAKLIIDIDLSILGSKPEHYEQFEGWIRKEYKLVPNTIYKKKRKEILESFYKRDRIYAHEYFYNKLETAARENISNAIRGL